MSDEGTSVTLIFYKIDGQFWKEPLLNIVAAAAQMSPFTHVEIALGEDPGHGGQMTNVARVFNDSIGVELTERTGRNPAYTYLSLGCSKASLHKMMAFARRQVGKPFSNYGMAMALLMPRKNDGTSWFCAELVSAILQEGNLMSADSNPSAATPQSLHKMYSKKAAVTANPYMLRKVTNLTFNTVTPNDVAIASAAQSMQRRKDAGADARFGGTKSVQSAASFAMASPTAPTSMGARRRSASPPKASFRVLQSCSTAEAAHAMRDAPPLGLSFESLKASR